MYFRVADVYRNIRINVYADDKLVKSVNKIKVAPGEMETVKLPVEILNNVNEICFKVEEK